VRDLLQDIARDIAGFAAMATFIAALGLLSIAAL